MAFRKLQGHGNPDSTASGPGINKLKFSVLRPKILTCFNKDLGIRPGYQDCRGYMQINAEKFLSAKEIGQGFPSGPTSDQFDVGFNLAWTEDGVQVGQHP